MILGLFFRNVLISTEHLYRVREIRTQIHKLKTAVVKDGNQSAPPPPESKPERFSPLLCSQKRDPDFPWKPKSGNVSKSE